jgi:hypothetical protein
VEVQPAFDAHDDQRRGQPYTTPESLRRCYERASEAFGWLSYQRPPAGGPGYAVHPSDLAPALLVLDAQVRLQGREGARTFIRCRLPRISSGEP